MDHLKKAKNGHFGHFGHFLKKVQFDTISLMKGVSEDPQKPHF